MKNKSLLKNYVIHVPSNQPRKQHIETEFAKHQIVFKFFPAITPEQNTLTLQKLGITADTSACSAGELSCLLSHVSLWQQCIDESLAYIGIFEDDILFGEQAGRVLNNPEWLMGNGLDFIKLEKFSEQGHFTSPRYCIKNTWHTVEKLQNRHLGGAGYILSRRAAEKLLTYIHQLPRVEAIDIILFDNRKYPKNLEVYQMLPAIVMQTDQYEKLITAEKFRVLASQLESTRGKEIKIQKTLGEKLKRELLRLFRPFYMTKIAFK